MNPWKYELQRLLNNQNYENEFIEILSENAYIAEFKKSSGFSFWVSAQDDEFIIGCDDNNSNCIWHLHIGSVSGYDMMSQVEYLKNQMDKIFNDKIQIQSALDKEEYWSNIT